MNKIKLISDSTCDLTDELLKKYDISIIPLYVNFGEESYQDRIDITTESLYQKVSEKGILPKTAAISEYTFEEEFKKWLNLGYDVIYTGISKALSRTYENALIAARNIDENRIKVVDSMNLSTGIGLTLIKAANAIKAGVSLDELEEKMNLWTKNVRSQFVIPTMDYLYKGGRCSGLAMVFGTVLKIKPIILVRDGKMTVGKKPHGKMKVALDTMFEIFDRDLGNIDQELIFVTHSLNEEDALYLKEEILRRLPNANVEMTCAGCVISSHCGKGTLGFLYMVNNNE